jgi:hypothetical protein
MCDMNTQKERESDFENFGTRITSFGAIFGDFSEARDLFVNIFQIPGPNCKFLDCGLILEKPRGPKCKMSKIPGITNYFSMDNVVDRVHTW